MISTIMKIIKSLFIAVIVACVAYQIQHIGLLLMEDDNECCPCMQLKMFRVELDKSSCCDCPNGFHLTFFFKDFVIESIYDLSWLVLVLTAFGVVFYSWYLFIRYSTQSLRHFVNTALFILIISYMAFQEKDGGLTKLIGRDTMYSVCNFRCSLLDSKKASTSCYSRCIDTYMNGDYLRLVENSKETLVKVGEMATEVHEYVDSVSEYAQTQYDSMSEVVFHMYNKVVNETESFLNKSFNVTIN